MPPAAHSFLEFPPREKPEWKRSGGGRGRPHAVLRALGGIHSESERTLRVRNTTHAARAKSVSVGAKMGSSSVVNTHHSRDEIGLGLARAGRGQRVPGGFRHAARFARVEGEVQKFKSQRFLEGLEGRSNARIQEYKYIVECLAPPRPIRARDCPSLAVEEKL